VSSETEYPVAYCAPGRRFAAALALMVKGEQVADIKEHSYLKGCTDVLVMAQPPEFSVDPEIFRLA
jgi:hypothetical protein